MKDLQCGGGALELAGSRVVDISRTCLFVVLVWQVRLDVWLNSHWVMLHVCKVILHCGLLSGDLYTFDSL
jgi:hypothetical protein